MSTETADTVSEALIMGVMTGSTCGDGCWHAREEVCRCSCGGTNHGILNRGGEQPGRTAKIGGEFYELVAVVPGRAEGECWADAYKRTSAAVRDTMDERFPGLETWAYGEWREGKMLPVLDRKVSASQAKWPEVAAVPNAYRLVWARPRGSKYLVRGLDRKNTWTTHCVEATAGGA